MHALLNKYGRCEWRLILALAFVGAVLRDFATPNRVLAAIGSSQSLWPSPYRYCYPCHPVANRIAPVLDTYVCRILFGYCMYGTCGATSGGFRSTYNALLPGLGVDAVTTGTQVLTAVGFTTVNTTNTIAVVVLAHCYMCVTYNNAPRV